MKKIISKSIQFIFFTSIACLLLYLVFKEIDLGSLWYDITQANYIWVACALILGFIGYVSRAYRWNLLIEPLGYKPKLYHSVLAVIFGYFANIGFPRLGEVARCGVLHKKSTIPMDKLIGTVIAERVIDLVVLIVLAIITFFIKIDTFGKFISNKIIHPTTSAFASINILILLLLLGIIVFIFSFFIITHKRNPFSKKIVDFIRGILQGIKSVYSLKKRKLFIFHTILIWTMYWGMTWAICFSIPQTSHLDAIDGLFLLIVGGVGMAVPVQNGMGVFHFIVGQAIAMYGLDFKTVGVLYATISHESQTLFVIVLGIITSIIIFAKKKKV